jgi:hypothetical protein
MPRDFSYCGRPPGVVTQVKVSRLFPNKKAWELVVVSLHLQKLGRLLMRAAPLVNAPVAALANSPRLGRLVNRNIAMLTYSGRRSGREVSIPVSYRRDGGEVTINVNMPDAKTWWRNFVGSGGPLTLRLEGHEKAGHAVAERDEKGRVTVKVRLDQ